MTVIALFSSIPDIFGAIFEFINFPTISTIDSMWNDYAMI